MTIAEPDTAAALRGEAGSVELVHVTKAFGATKAVDDLSIDVRAGEFLSLLGPSGCGKTTTLRMLAGFEHPNEGIIKVSGREMTRVPPYRRPINTVFQHYALFPHMDVARNVGYGLRQRRVGPSAGPSSSPAASSSASPWPGRWSTARRSCCLTNRSGPWTASCAPRCRSS